jgi:hypothetical protein
MKPIGWLIAAIFLAGVLVAGCIALVNDEDAFGGIVLVSHDYDDGCWDGECGRQRGDQYGGDGRGGYSGGPSGGYYEGGQGGDDYDGDGNGNRCRNFCVYPVEPPEGGQRV